MAQGYALPRLRATRRSKSSSASPSLLKPRWAACRSSTIHARLGRRPQEASADAGYCSEANLAALRKRRITAYIATGRAKHPGQDKRNLTGRLTKAMRLKLRRAGRRSRFRLRKQIVEPVFGQVKEARGFRQFLLRGPRQSEGRMGADLHRTQPHKAREGRMTDLSSLTTRPARPIWTGS